MIHVDQRITIGKDAQGKKIKKLITYTYLIELERKTKPCFCKECFHSIEFAYPRVGDLLCLKMDSGEVRPGWWTGTDWFCRTQREWEKILSWKRDLIQEDRVDIQQIKQRNLTLEAL